MPSLGADMDAGTLVEWLKAPGDELRRGDIIAVVETQKGAIEIEVFDQGVLLEMLVAPGERVPVGQPLALIGRDAADRETGEAAPAPPPSEPIAAPAPSPSPPRPPQPAEQVGGQVGLRLMASPAARRLAQELGLDLAAIEPDTDGIIGLREVEAAAATVPSGSQPRAASEAAQMRRAIGAAMERANRDIPHYYVTTTVDVTPMLAWLADYNESRPIVERLLYAIPLTRAVARALREFDDLNGTYEDGQFQPAKAVNLGIAIARRGGGLITPAILEADTLELPALMEKLTDLVRRVRTGGLRSSELSMGTATLTNLGEHTADSLLPIIYPPQVSIIGCGQVRLRPWVIGDAVVPRSLMDVTLAGDHRVTDGRRGAQFLRRLGDLFAEPEDL